MFDAALHTLTHGWHGLALGYGAVAAPMMAGAVRAGAPLGRILAAPFIAVPVTLVLGAGFGIVGGVAGFGLNGLSIGLGLLAGSAFGYARGVALAESAADGFAHQRGTRVVDGAVADNLLRARDRPGRTDRGPGRDRVEGVAGPAGRASKRDARGPVTVAGVALSVQDETRHLKIIGATGSGKSTAIRELLRAALARGDRAVIADPDGSYLRRFFDADRGDVLLNPFDPRSRKWDPFAEIRQPYDVDQLARSLIPDHGEADRSWSAYARTFFSAVMRQAHAGGERDVSELYRLLVAADAAELRTLVAGSAAQPFLAEHNTRMFDSIRSVTSSAVAALDYIGRQDGAPLSVRDWVGRGAAAGAVLFIPYHAGQIAALRTQISAWMRLAIFEAMDRPEGDQRLWFVVDELDALGAIDGLKDALARLRKFGGRCALGFQSVAQVSSTYGAGDAHTIVENCGNTLILRASASEGGGTARFASQLIGEREVVRTSVSRTRRALELAGSRTVSEHRVTEPAVLPAQIEQLPDLAGYLKVASRSEWLRVRLAAPERGAGCERD
ncbi:MAG TPA: type IV secretion system DNA-binding domain-containing protein [Steroidobacteraceae bacterium]|nr:type IV secretion system DNA-binding domain-containing protein [Steroidobacteraceae bacterium]